MSSPSLDDMSKSYEDHLKTFESQLDRPKSRSGTSSGQGASRSPQKQRSTTSIKKATASTSATRANSVPQEVVIGFTPSARGVSVSPDDTEAVTVKLADHVQAEPPRATPLATPQTTPLKRVSGSDVSSSGGGGGSASGAAASNAAASKQPAVPAKGPPSGKSAAPVAERGPKVDIKSLSKAERKALAAAQQEQAKAKRGGGGGGGAAKKAGDGDGAAAKPSAPKAGAPGANAGGGGGGSGGGAAKSAAKPAAAAAATSAAGAVAGGDGAVSALAGSAAVESAKRVPYFMHLPVWTGVAPQRIPEGVFVHAEVIRLGVKYANGSIRGSSARCAALIKAFECVVRDYSLPPKTEFAKHFYEGLRPMIQFLVQCRPKAESMASFIRSFKLKISQCRGKSESDGKEMLLAFLEEFLEERLLTAQQLIVDSALRKIDDGDVIITFGCSYVICRLLMAAHEAGKRFQLVIVDASPLNEGRELLHRLSVLGIPCTYVLLSAVSYLMKGATKVFIGAAALLSNGNLVSRVGTAAVCMTAYEYHVPVIVCCETVKFSAKCILDSITWNELGDPEELNDAPELANWREPKSSLTLLSLRYDVTPINYITMVICELGMVPPTSVPVILREYTGENAVASGAKAAAQ